MTDTATTPNEEPTTEQVEPETPETDWRAEAERLKAEARKWESRSKENAKAAQRLAELEESQKTDLQKALERAEAAEKQVQEFRSVQQIAEWKSQVEKDTGVPASALRGSTLEDLQAHAEELRPLLESRRGPYVPSPGNIPDSPVSDVAQVARQLFGSRG